MEAQALICNEAQEFALNEVQLPDAGTDRVIVRTLHSGVSVGTEFALVRNKISWGPYPICTGYQGVGVVERVGTTIDEFSPGDLVYYRDNREITLADGTAVSAASGTHCSHASINPSDTHGLALLPANVAIAPASLFVMPAVGLFGVDMANPRMGDVVVVFGCGPIGLGVVAACAHRGCFVIAADLDQKRLDAASELGADVCVDGSKEDIGRAVKSVAPDGADVVFEATGIPQCIDEAIPLARTFGKFVWQGNYGASPIELHFLPAHGRKLQMFFPCDDGLEPCRRAVIKNMGSGALQWDKTITHVIEAVDAPEFFSAVNASTVRDLVCATIHWSD